MEPIEPYKAAQEVSAFLAERGLRSVVIGGLAVQVWGEPRLTTDADLTLPFPEQGSRAIVEVVTSRFPSRASDPFDMALKTRMILITASNGVEVDMSLALPGYEDSLFSRAREHEMTSGITLHICSPEDLVIHKAVAGRPQDIADIRGVVFRQGRKLDIAYVREWLDRFGAILEEPQIPERFEQVWMDYLRRKHQQ